MEESQKRKRDKINELEKEQKHRNTKIHKERKK